MTAEAIAQWVIDNRYPKNENDKISDFEMYHEIINKINNKRSIFFDMPETKCLSTSHFPPNNLYIPNGKQYRHVCPQCGNVTIILAPNITSNRRPLQTLNITFKNDSYQ